MTIDTAKFLIQRAGVQSYCTGADLITKLQPGDLMAVTRPGDGTYKWVKPITKYKYRYTIDTEGKTAGNTSFKLSVLSNVFTILFDVNWGDGTEDTGVTDNEILHTYPSVGIYSIEVTTDELHPWRTGRGYADEMQMILSFDGCDDDFPFGGSIQNMFFTASKLTSIEPFDTTGITNFNAAFKDCTSYTGAFPFLDTSSGTNFGNAFNGSNWSSFPLIDCSSGLNFNEAWSFCMQLTSFPQLDLSSGTTFNETWRMCQFTAFPEISFDSATSLNATWNSCQGLESFGNLYAPNATSLSGAFNACFSLQSIGDITFSSEPTDLGGLFDGCRDLTSIGTISDTSNVTSMADIAKACSSLPSWPQLDYSSNQSFNDAFRNCNQMVTWGDGSPTPLPELLIGKQAWLDCDRLASFPQCTFPKATSLEYAWSNCTQMTTWGDGTTTVEMTEVLSLRDAWSSCSSLETISPINAPKCKSFYLAWYANQGIEDFPALDCSSGENFQDAWNSCANMKNFPSIDVSKGTNFVQTWSHCQTIQTFPQLSFTSGTNFTNCWKNNYALTTFFPNAFNTTGVLNSNAFVGAFTGCALTQQSIENILVSWDTNGQSNIQADLDGGTNAGKWQWTAAALAAYDNLIAKGWTITHNEGVEPPTFGTLTIDPSGDRLVIDSETVIYTPVSTGGNIPLDRYNVTWSCDNAGSTYASDPIYCARYGNGNAGIGVQPSHATANTTYIIRCTLAQADAATVTETFNIFYRYPVPGPALTTGGTCFWAIGSTTNDINDAWSSQDYNPNLYFESASGYYYIFRFPAGAEVKFYMSGSVNPCVDKIFASATTMLEDEGREVQNIDYKNDIGTQSDYDFVTIQLQPDEEYIRFKNISGNARIWFNGQIGDRQGTINGNPMIYEESIST